MVRLLFPVLLVVASCALALAAAAQSAAGPAALWTRRIAEARDYKLWIAVATTLLLAADWLLRRLGRDALLRRPRGVLLVALALTTLFAWWHPYRGSLRAWLHVGDTFHYYMGAKYFQELGYTRLYRCAVIADAEAGLAPQLARSQIRNLETNGIESARRALEDPASCKRHFSPERWRAFSRDLGFFRARLTLPLWFKLRTDHGYNPPPVWTLVGSPLANTGPPGRTQFFVLTALDPLLLAVLFAAVAWAFGWRTACIAFIYWGTNQIAGWEWVGGSILRFDWLAASVAGVCCLRRGRPVAAGLLVAWATGVRIFPVAIAAGVVLAALLRMLQQRSATPTRAEVRFAAAFGAGLAVLVAASALVVGPESWLEFGQNSRTHLETESVNRTGLRPLLAYRHETRVMMTIDERAADPYHRWRELRAATYASRRPLFVLLVTVYLALLVLALRQQPDWVAGVLGIGAVPVLLELGSYYFGVLLAFACLARRREDVGVALMLLSCVSWWVGRWDGPDRDVISARMSLAILLFVAFATLRMIRRPETHPPPAGPDATA